MPSQDHGPSTADHLVSGLRQRLQLLEEWARAAKGVRWQWVYGETDEVITPTLDLDEFLTARHPEGHDVATRIDLRSVERVDHPAESGYGRLPAAWPLSNAEEVDPASAGHIIRWSPASVLRLVAAHRKVIELWEGARDAYVEWRASGPSNDPLWEKSDAMLGGQVTALRWAIEDLAEGFGLQDSTEEPT